MNKTKLEVIRINEDVITTSITTKGVPLDTCVVFTDVAPIGQFDINDKATTYTSGICNNDAAAVEQLGYNQAMESLTKSGTTFAFNTFYSYYSDGTNYYLYKCSDVGHTTHNPS